MKITITSVMGSVLFEGDFTCLVKAVEAAIKSSANLRYADLRYANLRYADLSSANLRYANLSSTNLRYANLRYANLSSADLRYANLRYADLRSANLRYADLSSADLSSANLRSANLSSADLSSANLRSANLRSANLRYANLSSTNLRYAEGSELAIAMTRILPEGEIVGWKKLSGNVIAKLLIPAAAKRSHAFGRKCRAEFATVLELTLNGKPYKANGCSHYDNNCVYVVGATIKCGQQFDEHWMNECSSGIHFFITKAEAIAYNL